MGLVTLVVKASQVVPIPRAKNSRILQDLLRQKESPSESCASTAKKSSFCGNLGSSDDLSELAFRMELENSPDSMGRTTRCDKDQGDCKSYKHVQGCMEVQIPGDLFALARDYAATVQKPSTLYAPALTDMDKVA